MIVVVLIIIEVMVEMMVSWSLKKCWSDGDYDGGGGDDIVVRW